MAETTEPRRRTATSAFGTSRRESHDSTGFYDRFTAPELSDDTTINPVVIDAGDECRLGDSSDMRGLPDNSVALVVTSPPYFVGKEYEDAVAADRDERVPSTYFEYLSMLESVFAECARVLEPGGRIAVNVANLGRKPYRSLSADVIAILQDLGLLLRGEIIWKKGKTLSGSCAWGSFTRPANPVLRDTTERVVVAGKGRFDRALSASQRAERGLPNVATLSNDEFLETTTDVWEIDPESARRVGHPAPFPIELPRRLIELYTYTDDVVLDPFMGSGTTLVAAELSDRRGVGYDLDPEYVDLARDRLATARERSSRLKQLRAEQMPLDIQVHDLPHEERQEHFQARAVREGKKAQNIARELLERVGFIIEENVKVPGAGVQFNFKVTSPASHDEWLVDVSGAFTTVRPGLMRIDTLWKTLGRIHVLKGSDATARVLVLTSNLPRPGSEGDKALRTAGPDSIFDAVEMFDPLAEARLREYAEGRAEPAPGFWDRDDIVRRTS